MFLLHYHRYKTNIILLLITLFSLPAIFALFHSGFFQSDDGEWMVIRFTAFYQAFADGQFPVRFLARLNNEYGYPVANFLYPGFMYLGIPIKLLGVGFVDTIKIIIGIAMIGSAVGSYLWLSRLFSLWPAFIGALVFLYSPYHLFDLYNRGSIGEILALLVVPIVLWQIEKKSLLWGSVGIGMLLLSHNTLALLFLPMLAMYMALRSKTRNQIFAYISIIILGIGLAAFFWIPALFDLQYTKFSKTQVSEWMQYFAPFSLIGVVPLICIVGLLFLKKKKLTIVEFFFLFVATCSLFFAIPLSSFLWQILPVSVVQFPFRVLSLTILAAAFLTASFLSRMPRKTSYGLGIVMLFLSLVSSAPYIIPNEFVKRDEGFYTTNMATTTVQNEYMPKWVMTLPSQRASQKVTVQDGGISMVQQDAKRIHFSVDTPVKTRVFVHTMYFPGWEATVNGTSASIEYTNPQGIISLAVPQGNSTVSIVFKETLVRIISDIISVSSLITILVLSVVSKKKKYV